MGSLTKGQSSALTSRDRQQSGWLSPPLPSKQRPEERPQMSCPPPQWFAEHTRPNERRPEQRPRLLCPPPQRQAVPTPNKRTEARTTPSPDVPAATVADWAHADRTNRSQSTALTCRARHQSGCLSHRGQRKQKPKQRPQLSCRKHRGWLIPRRPSNQSRPEQRTHFACPPTHRLAKPTTTERTEAGEAPSNVVPATTVVGWDQADRPSEQKPDQRPYLSCPPTQWLAETTPTDKTEARAAPSTVVPVTTVDGWTQADQENRVQSSAFTCRARHHRCWLNPTPTKRTEARAVP
jgi:hypothetical protein